MPLYATRLSIIRLPGALLTLALAVATAGIALADPRPPLSVRVMVINAFPFEAGPWLAALHPEDEIAVPGLGKDGPAVRCTRRGVCQMTTGMGHANAAASATAVLFSGLFDLRKTYFLIAGIAGISPAEGTIGSAAWARYAVDIGITHEIDAREKPASWADGYFGVMTDTPKQKPAYDYRTEFFRLDESLLQAALALSNGAVLDDNAAVASYRTHYPQPAARHAPTVIQCDTASADTWWSGRRIGHRVEAWTRLLTDGAGRYCTTQQEDNATLVALTRGADAGLVDLRRVMVLRSGSDFDRPYPHQSPYASLIDQRRILSGAGTIAVDNLVHAGMPVVDAIIHHWEQWETGVPADPAP